jgi:hypothetical protein
MAATRYAVMMLRFAQPELYAPKPRDKYDKHGYAGDDSTWMSS